MGSALHTMPCWQQRKPSLLCCVRISQLTPPQYLGPGGVILALGATLFAREQIDVLVVEAGRGGAYDEARLVEADVSVLTPVMLEHVDKLGPTVQDIAKTKASITAPGSPLVSAPQTRAMQTVIETVEAEPGFPVFSVESAARIDSLVSDLQGAHCALEVQEQIYRDLHIPLSERHQQRIRRRPSSRDTCCPAWSFVYSRGRVSGTATCPLARSRPPAPGAPLGALRWDD